MLPDMVENHSIPPVEPMREGDPIEGSPMYATDPNRRPGGAYWYRDRPDYDNVHANILEHLAVMLWEEMLYLRDGSEPEGTGIPRQARLSNISAGTSAYANYTMKDLRPRGLWDQPLRLF
jgi:hypothetical protein